MKKIYFLLALLCSNIFLNAQTGNHVNFDFTADPLTNNVVFTNTSVLQSDGARKAYWYFGDGTHAVTAPLAGTAHHYNVAGTYQVCLKIWKYSNTSVADSVLLGSVCKSVTLQQHCTAGFQWSDSVATNSYTHYVKFFGFGSNNANKPIKEICWNFGDGTDTCIQATAGALPPLNILHKYTQGGTYNVCIRIKYDGGCVAEKCQTIALGWSTIADTCSANFTTHPVTATPLGRKFVAQPWHSRYKKPVRICWTFGDGKDTCIQYPANYTGDYWVEHKYTQYGQYEVCTIIKYDGGCEKKKCQTIVVASPTPPADSCVFTLNETPVNQSTLERKFFIGLMTNRRAEKICWSFGDGTDTCVILSNPMNPQQLMITHLYAAPGNYTVCAKVYYAGGCVVQKCKQIAINIPHTNICGGYMTDSATGAKTVRFKGTGIQNPNDFVTSYTWSFGDGTTATGQVVTHTFPSAGRYNVCLFIRTNSGCETKICKHVGVAGTSQPQLVLTTNPVINTLSAIFHSLFQQQVSVKIYNANGVMVRSYIRNVTIGANSWTFTDVAILPTGVYSVIVQSPNQFATAIFFKQ